MLESPLEDDQVDRSDVYVEQSTQLTDTNGRMLGHIYPTLLIQKSPWKSVVYIDTFRRAGTRQGPEIAQSLSPIFATTASQPLAAF